MMGSGQVDLKAQRENQPSKSTQWHPQPRRHGRVATLKSNSSNLPGFSFPELSLEPGPPSSAEQAHDP